MNKKKRKNISDSRKEYNEPDEVVRNRIEEFRRDKGKTRVYDVHGNEILE